MDAPFYTVRPLEEEIQDKITRRGYSAKLDIQEGERAVIFIINTDEIGRDGLVVLPKGGQLKAFEKNPRVMWAHDYSALPIAFAKWVRVIDGQLRAKAIFAEEELNPLAEQVYQMLIADPPFLQAVSIGFHILEKRKATPSELKNHPDWPTWSHPQDPGHPEVDDYVVSKWELLEFSVVPIPADREALALAVARGMQVPKQVMETLDEKKKAVPTYEEIVNLHELINDSAKRPYPNEHSCRLEDPKQFDKFARKSCEQKHADKCIDVIYGIKAGKSKAQALRYNKSIWDAGAARSHCKTREGTFEEASESKEKALQDEIEVLKNQIGAINSGRREMITEQKKTIDRKILALKRTMRHIETLERKIKQLKRENHILAHKITGWIDEQLGSV